MSFKQLSDAIRIKALWSFLEAASQLKGVLVCFAVEKGFSFPKGRLPNWQHNLTADTLNKLIEVCVLGGLMVDGLRGPGQNVHWITDDDSIVSTEGAVQDAIDLMEGVLHRYANEELEVRLGIASHFEDDLRAEDLVAIPDVAAGALSESLTTLGKANMATSGSGPSGIAQFDSIKTSLIHTWRCDKSQPLKHMNAVVRRADEGKMLLSFLAPFSRMLRPGESADGAPSLNSKWRLAIEADLNLRGIDPKDVLKSLGIEGLD